MAAPSILQSFCRYGCIGLALVDDVLIRLRAIARAARSEMAQRDTESVLRILLQQFCCTLNKLIRATPVDAAWFNPNLEYRKTIRRELAIMQGGDLAGNMREAASMPMFEHHYDTESEAVLSC